MGRIVVTGNSGAGGRFDRRLDHLWFLTLSSAIVDPSHRLVPSIQTVARPFTLAVAGVTGCSGRHPYGLAGSDRQGYGNTRRIGCRPNIP